MQLSRIIGFIYNHEWESGVVGGTVVSKTKRRGSSPLIPAIQNVALFCNPQKILTSYNREE